MEGHIVTILFSVGLYILGMIFFLIGHHLQSRARQFLAASVEVLGTVVCIVKFNSPQSEGTVYAPMVSYHDSEGKLYTITKRWGTASLPCEEGIAWPVFFLPNDPHIAKLGPRNEILRPARNCFVIGSILLLIATLILLAPLFSK
jgi:hypothetical protein